MTASTGSPHPEALRSSSVPWASPTSRTLLDPENPNRAALLADVPDMAAFEAAMQTREAAEAMEHDGVRAETMIVLVEA